MNVGDLGKLIVAKGFLKLPKVQKIAQSGHTASKQERRGWVCNWLIGSAEKKIFPKRWAKNISVLVKQKKIMPMTGFEPRTSGVVNDHFTNWATTTPTQFWV